MKQFLIFNHHSLPIESIEQLDVMIMDFLRIVINMQNIGKNTVLLDESIDSNWFRVELFRGYTWQDWYNKSKNISDRKDLIRAFRAIKTRQPLFLRDENECGLDLIDMRFRGVSLLSISAAVWYGAPIVSFPSRSPWDSTPLCVEVYSLTDECTIEKSHKYVDNVYSIDIFGDIKNKLQKEAEYLIESGSEVFKNKENLYPFVMFCGKSENQLMLWSHSLVVLGEVKNSLFVLNDFVEKWRANTILYYSHEVLRELGLNHKVNGESNTVMNSPSLRKYREFWLPDGRKKCFENHIKFSSGYRLHFYPDIDTRTVYVGYIGVHLPIK
jgi:hypothetical protein